MLLEQLFHRTSHPTREEREALANAAGMYAAPEINVFCFHNIHASHKTMQREFFILILDSSVRLARLLHPSYSIVS